MKDRKDVSLTIRLSQPLKDALERAADADRRSLSQLVGLVLEKFLEERDEWPPPSRSNAKRTTPAARRR